MPNTTTPAKSQFKESLTGFAFSTPTRKSSRISAKQVSSNEGLKLKRTISDVDDTSGDESSGQEVEETPIKKAKVKPKPKTKKTTIKRGYASPEKYAHLSGLTDILDNDLDIIFCGINPGLMSATQGHHFANPRNHFWRALHLSGLTSRLVLPSEDASLPQLYSLGLTDLVYRASAEQAELSKDEMKQSVPALLSKVTRYKPRVLCFIGKGIWLIVEAVLKQQLKQHGKISRFAPNDASHIKSEVGLKVEAKVKSEIKLEDGIKSEGVDIKLEDDVKIEVKVKSKVKSEENSKGSDDVLNSRPPMTATKKKTKAVAFDWGLQPYKLVFDKDAEISTTRETLIFVSPSTSGRVVSHQLTDKIELFKTLRNTVQDIKQGKLDTAEMIPIDADAASS